MYKNNEQQLLRQKHEIDSLRGELSAYSGANLLDEKMGQEMKVLFPSVRTVSVSKGLQLQVDSTRMDTLTFAFIDCDRELSMAEKEKMRSWLKARTGTDKLRLIVE